MPRRVPFEHLGGAHGNEALTRITGVVLLALLAAEGVTVLSVESMVRPHMFIGLVLIPPVLLKLATTGYRFVRYYTGAPVYREQGPPAIVPRLTAPILVLATVSLFSTGVWMLALGHVSDGVLTVHATSAVVWVGAFAIHLLSHGATIARTVRTDWGALLRRSLAGSGARSMLLLASLGGGVALALALLGLITGWHGD